MGGARIHEDHSCLLCTLQDSEDLLRADLLEASAAARSAGEDRIVRVELPCPGASLWPVLRAAASGPAGIRGAGGTFAAWHDPVCALSFVALGEVARLPGSSLEAARRGWSALRARLFEPTFTPGSARRFVGGRELLPFVVGGAAFAQAGEEAWETWPRARFWVPELLLARGPRADGQLICHLAIGPRSDVDAVLRDLRLRLHELQVGARHGSAPASAGQGLRRAAVGAKRGFCGKVDAARAAIADGRFHKVVLAREASIQAPQGALFDAVASFERLRAQQPSAICFALSPGQPGCFLGATPEILLRVVGRRFRSTALAGTAPRSADPAADRALAQGLLHSAKDRAEQGLVVAAIREALAPRTEVLDIANKPSLRRLSGAFHLESRVSGCLAAGEDAWSLLAALHPTPAVGGWPAAPAADWLAAHEELDRGWYAGPVGWLDATGNGVFAVAIRSALVRPTEARAWAGAGIVADSQPEAEWRETELKLHTVLQALAIRALSPRPARLPRPCLATGGGA